MSQLQKALIDIKKLEEQNSVLEQLVDTHKQVNILYKEKLETIEKQLELIKLSTRFIFN